MSTVEAPRAATKVLPKDPARDAETFEELYRQYGPALTAFCRRRLPDPQEAEDACHDAMIKAWRGLGGFEQGRSPWPWLATIAAHVCIDRHRLHPAISRSALGETEPGEDADVEDQAARHLREDMVRDALGSIPEPYRTPLFLREIDGLKYEQIASTQRKSVASVRTTLMRGRRLLKQRIEEIARSRGEWPLGVVPLGWWRIRARLHARRHNSPTSTPSWCRSLDPSWASLLSPAEVIAAIAVTLAAVTFSGFTNVPNSACPWPCESPHLWPAKVPTSVT